MNLNYQLLLIGKIISDKTPIPERFNEYFIKSIKDIHDNIPQEREDKN